MEPSVLENRLTLYDPAQDGSALVVLVHGFGSQPEGYWGKLHPLLINDGELWNAGVRFAFWGYPTAKWPQPPDVLRKILRWPTLPDIRSLGKLLWDDLTQSRYERFSRIALFGHSLGGLISQAAACQAVDRAASERLITVGLCATPTAGSGLADLASFMAKFWGGNVQLNSLGVGAADRADLQQHFFQKVLQGSERDRISVVAWRAVSDPYVTEKEMETYYRVNHKVIAGDHASCVRTEANAEAFTDWITGSLVGSGRAPATVASTSAERLYDYLRQLAELYSGSPEGYEEELELHHYVSESARDVHERVIRMHSPRDPVYFKRVGFGCTQDVGPPRSIEDLDISLTVPEGCTPLLVPLSEAPNLIEGGIFFYPPLEGDQEITVRQLWKGCWDPLRSEGKDEGVFGLKGATKRVVVEIEFPAGTSGIRVEAVPADVKYDFNAVRPKAILVYNRVEPGEYRYEVYATLPTGA